MRGNFPKKLMLTKKKMYCWLLGHKWEFLFVNIEGHKVFSCTRCEKLAQGKYVKQPRRKPNK